MIEAKLINGSRNIIDEDFSLIQNYTQTGGVIDGLEVTTDQVGIGKAILQVERSSKPISILVRVDDNHTIDTSGTKKVFIDIDDFLINNPSVIENNVAADVSTADEYPEFCVKLASIDNGVITDERQPIKLKGLRGGMTINSLFSTNDSDIEQEIDLEAVPGGVLSSNNDVPTLEDIETNTTKAFTAKKEILKGDGCVAKYLGQGIEPATHQSIQSRSLEYAHTDADGYDLAQIIPLGPCLDRDGDFLVYYRDQEAVPPNYKYKLFNSSGIVWDNSISNWGSYRLRTPRAVTNKGLLAIMEESGVWDDILVHIDVTINEGNITDVDSSLVQAADDIEIVTDYYTANNTTYVLLENAGSREVYEFDSSAESLDFIDSFSSASLYYPTIIDSTLFLVSSDKWEELKIYNIGASSVTLSNTITYGGNINSIESLKDSCYVYNSNGEVNIYDNSGNLIQTSSTSEALFLRDELRNEGMTHISDIIYYRTYNNWLGFDINNLSIADEYNVDEIVTVVPPYTARENNNELIIESFDNVYETQIVGMGYHSKLAFIYNIEQNFSTESIEVPLYKKGNPSKTITATLYEDDNGQPGSLVANANEVYDSNDINTFNNQLEYKTFTFDNLSSLVGTYWIVLVAEQEDYGNEDSYYLTLRADQPEDSIYTTENGFNNLSGAIYRTETIGANPPCVPYDAVDNNESFVGLALNDASAGDTVFLQNEGVVDIDGIIQGNNYYLDDNTTPQVGRGIEDDKLLIDFKL